MTTRDASFHSARIRSMMRAVAMPKPVYITAPRPTLEEMEKHLRYLQRPARKSYRRLWTSLRLNFPVRREAPANSIEPEKRRKRASAA